MTPNLLKVFYTIASFIVGASLLLLFIVPPDSPEYIVTLMSTCVGAALLILVVLTSPLSKPLRTAALGAWKILDF